MTRLACQLGLLQIPAAISMLCNQASALVLRISHNTSLLLNRRKINAKLASKFLLYNKEFHLSNKSIIFRYNDIINYLQIFIKAKISNKY